MWRMRFFCGGGDLPLQADDTQCNFKGACFEADLIFNPGYPLDPPTLKFIEPIPYHPNVYNGGPRHGEVCISMLHKAGADAFNALETADERWSISYSIYNIGASVMYLLGQPNMNGGAPADAAINQVLKDAPKVFLQRTEECAKRSRDKVPARVFERAARDVEAFGTAQKKVFAAAMCLSRWWREMMMVRAQKKRDLATKRMGVFDEPDNPDDDYV